MLHFGKIPKNFGQNLAKKSKQGKTSSKPTDLNSLKERMHRSMLVAFNKESELIELNLTFLATSGSTAPFIGLFGTVWGIMNSFQSIATAKNTSLAIVAPGIAEALLATALGLLAAIPALMAYNYFRNSVRKQANDMRDFSMELANRIEWIIHGQLTVARE